MGAGSLWQGVNRSSMFMNEGKWLYYLNLLLFLLLFSDNFIYERFVYLSDFSTCMTEVIMVGDKGQIVIPKQISMLMLLSESSLMMTWDNEYDQKWDDCL